MKLSKTLLIILTLSLISGCSSPLGVVTDVLTPSKGISVDTQIGEEANKQIVNDLTKTTTDIEIDTDGDVTQTTDNSKIYNKTVNSNIPPFYLVLLVLGWLLPDPKSIYKEIKSWFIKSS